MCGIAGMYGTVDKGLLQDMGEIQQHRGPDDQGLFLDNEIGLVTRRLSIIDIDGGHQPMSNEDGSVWVAFNGEIYNFLDLRGELLAKNHRFNSRSDTEVIVHAYEEWGEHFLSRLNGMFAIALWDGETRQLLVARDRLGIKPIYFAAAGDTFLFASELKALLIHPEISRALDETAISNFLSRRFPLGDRTPFQSIRRIPLGSMCRVSREGVDFVSFWDIPSTRAEFAMTDPAAQLERALEDSVRRQLISDVTIGISLSGGLDSSSLAAMAVNVSSEEVSTFTAGFGEKIDELQAAEQVAEFLGTRHREVMISYAKMTSMLPLILWHLDEPVADPAILPTYSLMKFARESVKVALLGEGADELFGGYSHYKLAAPPFSFLPVRFRRDLYHRVNLIFSSAERDELLAATSVNGGDEDFFEPAFKRLAFGEAMMRSELKNVLPNFQLHRVDRMSMAHSLEARVPYLDDVVVRVALETPQGAKIRSLSRKVVLRRAMKDLLPRSVLRRRKRIFRVPLRKWFSEELGEALETLLDTSELFRKTFKGGSVKRLLSRSSWRRSERAAYKAWMMGMLDLWHRTFVERDSSELKSPIRSPW